MMKIARYAALLAIGAAVLFSTQPVAAQAVVESPETEEEECGDARFLGFPPWYRGLTETVTIDKVEKCEIKALSGDDKVSGFIWTIVLNVIEMLLVAAGYAATAFIIYGGYKYMISAGSPDGMVAARKTIMNAVIGLILSVAAIAIVNTVSKGILLGQ